MRKPFLGLSLCLAALIGSTAHAETVPAPTYSIDYKLADQSGHVVHAGRLALSARNPINGTSSYTRVAYISACRGQFGTQSDEPPCQVESADIGDSLQFALGGSSAGGVTVTAWVQRDALDGMANIEHVGYTTQRPRSTGWNDSRSVEIPLDRTATVSLRGDFTLTLSATRVQE